MRWDRRTQADHEEGKRKGHRLPVPAPDDVGTIDLMENERRIIAGMHGVELTATASPSISWVA